MCGGSSGVLQQRSDDAGNGGERIYNRMRMVCDNRRGRDGWRGIWTEKGTTKNTGERGGGCGVSVSLEIR